MTLRRPAAPPRRGTVLERTSVRADLPVREDLGDLFDPGDVDLFPFVEDPPDILIQIQDGGPLPGTLGSLDPLPGGCLPDQDALTLQATIRAALVDLGVTDPDVRVACVTLSVDQPLGNGLVGRRSATTVAAWEKRTILPAQNHARARALESADLILGLESYCTLYAARAREDFLASRAAAEVRDHPDRNDEGDPDPDGKLHLTGAEVRCDEPEDAVSLILTARRDLVGGLQIGVIETLRLGDERGELRIVPRTTATFDRRIEAALLERLGFLDPPEVEGALARLSDLFVSDVRGFSVAYIDFSIDPDSVTARGAVLGPSIRGPGEVTQDPRSPAPVQYRAELPIPFGGTESPFAWDLDGGTVSDPDGQIVSVTFDTGGRTGLFVRRLGLTVTDPRGIRHRVVREIRVRSVLLSLPFSG